MHCFVNLSVFACGWHCPVLVSPILGAVGCVRHEPMEIRPDQVWHLREDLFLPWVLRDSHRLATTYIEKPVCLHVQAEAGRVARRDETKALATTNGPWRTIR